MATLLLPTGATHTFVAGERDKKRTSYITLQLEGSVVRLLLYYRESTVFLSPSICGRANRESLISKGHPVKTFAGDGGDPRVEVLAETVALGSRGTRVPDKVEGLKRAESTQQLAHLSIMAPTGHACIKGSRIKALDQGVVRNAWPGKFFVILPRSHLIRGTSTIISCRGVGDTQRLQSHNNEYEG